MLSPSSKYVVLLPSDKELISKLGITEAEYRWFVRECYRHCATQPASTQPQAILPVTIGVILLTIGTLLSTAASFFKPKPGGGGGGIRQNTDQGQNIVNQSEFAPKAGFDSLQNVVELGSTIPLVYANRESINDITYGGVRVNTNLLWSQMMSFGNSQLLRAIYLISEGEIGPLDIKQFAFGENILGGYDLGSQIANESAARMTFYVKRNGGRFFNADRVAGRLANSDPGNAINAGGADVFSIKGLNDAWTKDFCYAYKPSTQTKFGVYSLIGAGMCHRVNPVMRPSVTAQTEPADGGKKIRIKCSTDAISLAQRKKYNERFDTFSGYVAVNGASWQGTYTERVLNEGDIISYLLSGESDAKKTFTAGKGDSKHTEKCIDVAQTVAGLQRSWDDSISVGELYKIGTAHVVCESRSPIDDIFVSEATQEPIGGRKSIDVTFRVVKAGYSRLDEPKSTTSVRVATNTGHLLRLTIAAFSLPRSAQVIEIGFKSVLGIRIGGLCNFRDALSHSEIDGKACEYYEGRKYGTSQTLTLSNYSSGTYSGVETRYSFFFIGYRVAGTNDEFKYLKHYFGIRGATQQNVFNYIRLQMPSFQTWEYIIEPISGYEIRFPFHGDFSLEILDSKISTVRSITSEGVTAYFNGTTVARNRKTFQMTPTRANRDLGIIPTDRGESSKSSDDDYADTWGRLAEAFCYQEIQSSASRGPEHEIAYVNIITPNPVVPMYPNMGLIGVNIRSGNEFQQLKQLSVYISRGCGNGVHTFPEVFLDLLTNTRYGVGSVLSPEQVDTTSIMSASSWTRNRKYFWDGTLDKPVNIRQWASQTANFFLLDVVIRNGKWSLQPSFYFDQPEPITDLYTFGNILENSFEYIYTEVQQRQPKRISVKWRHERPDNITNSDGIFPVIREVNVRESTTPDDAPLESIDLSDFCTSQAHAIDVAKYMCKQPRLLTNTIRFKTVPTQSALQVGRCFKLGVETVQYNQPNNGVIDAYGNISSINPLPDGTYSVLLWNGTGSTVQEVNLVVINGKSSNYFASIFCLKTTTVDTIAYKVQSLSFDEDGNLQVEANVFPLKSNGYALITDNWDNPSAWIIEGAIDGSQNSGVVQPIPTSIYISGPDTVIVDEDVQYQVIVNGSTAPATYAWSASGSITFLTDQDESSVTITSLSSGTKTLTVSVLGQTVSKNIEFFASSDPTLTIGLATITGPVVVSSGVPIDYSVSYLTQPAPISASQINADDTYQIVSTGSTNFQLIGADSNLPKTVFDATGPGTGSGTVRDMNSVFIAWDVQGVGQDSIDTLNTSAPVTTITFDKGGSYAILCTVSSPNATDSPQTAVLQITVIAPVITVAATDPEATEVPTGGAQDQALFTLTRTGVVTSSLTVNVSIAGTAIPGTDYTVIPTTVTFPAGSETATVPVSVIYDTAFESAETVVLTVIPGVGYEVGMNPSATATIAENSKPIISIFPVSMGLTGNVLEFVVTRTGSVTGSSSVPWSTVGTTVNPALAIDFVGNALPSGTVAFAANETNKILSITTNSATTNTAFFKSFKVLLGTPTNATLSVSDSSALGLILTEPSTNSSGGFRDYSSVTINCAANATVTGTIVLPKSCVIIGVTVSQACWFRLYSSQTASAGDAARLRTVPPGLATGVIADPVLPGAVTLNFEPAPVAMSREVVPVASYPFRLTNDAATGDIIITLTYLTLES